MSIYNLLAYNNSLVNNTYPALYPLVATVISRLITHPIYVLVTRLQLSSKLWSWQVIINMVRDEGIGSFYRGLTANIVKSIVLSIVQDTLTEKFGNHITHQATFGKKMNALYIFDAFSIITSASLLFRY